MISTLKLIALMEEACPGVEVQVIGETDILLEWVDIHKHTMKQQWIKVVFVCLISFFGSAFTIMAYHNDSGIIDIFDEIYRICMNREPGSINVMEVAYSVGLAGGIILFFNHVGGFRITKDPTPIEVAMKKYEMDVDMTVMENAERTGEEIDV